MLGPEYFLVYVNDVQNVLNDCDVKLYADDTVICQSGVNSKIASGKLQTSLLDLFVNWCLINQLTINIQKTKVMIFGSRHILKKAKNINIKINGTTLKVVPSYTNLGLQLDSTLNYNLHISTVIRTVLHKLTLLAKTKKYMNDDVATSIWSIPEKVGQKWAKVGIFDKN